MMLGRKKPETVALSLSEFEGMKCVHCGGAHYRACPRVKRMRFGVGGALEEVEFWPEGQYSTDSIIFAEDIVGSDEVE